MLLSDSNKSLEQTLVEVLDRYQVEIDRKRFLTVCGKCGGNVVTCEGEASQEIVRQKQAIVEKRKNERLAPGRGEGVPLDDLRPVEVSEGCGGEEGDGLWTPTDREIYKCEDCSQVRVCV
jgi:hypothetical protein